MEWNVFRYDINKNKIDVFNIFNHGSFYKYTKKAIKEYKIKGDFAEQLRRELMYFFWSKAEHELVIEITENNRIFLNPWCGCRNPEEVRIDVTDDKKFDWKCFAEEHINKQVYKNKAKINIYDQVMSNWEKFLDYVWDNRSKI